MAMATRSLLRFLRSSSARFCSTTTPSPSVAEPAAAPPGQLGVADFLKSIGNGLEAHTAKIEKDVPELEQLLQIRTMKLKKIGIPCKHRKLILRHTEKYRQGLWRPKIMKS